MQSDSVGLRPVRQAGGVVRFDGGDDNLLTALAGAAAGNAFIAKVTVPASLAAMQVVAGFNAASNGRFQAAGMDLDSNPSAAIEWRNGILTGRGLQFVPDEPI